MRIRSVIQMAKDGMTKQQIIDALGLDEATYKAELKQFSAANRATLHRLLIANGNKATQANKRRVVNILDTSYILSGLCIFEEVKSAAITPMVYEQLMIANRNGSKKVCKFMHMLLDGRIDAKLVKEVENVDACPSYEDPADMEILAYAKQLQETKTPVVYTTDKGLAGRCMQQGIKFKFFEMNPNT